MKPATHPSRSGRLMPGRDPRGYRSGVNRGAGYTQLGNHIRCDHSDWGMTSAT